MQNRLATSTTWEDLVELFASGPPALSVFKVLDPVASIHEMFVHHEDVRRAQTGWEPRELDASTAAAVKRRVAIISRAGMSKSMAAVPARLTLRTGDLAWPYRSDQAKLSGAWWGGRGSNPRPTDYESADKPS